MDSSQIIEDIFSHTYEAGSWISELEEGHSLNILLVDDEDIVHQTLGSYLRDCGHYVDHAEEGTTTLRLIETKEYDLVLLDIRMPGMDGLSVLAHIHGLYPELSLVMVTGHGNMEIVIQALRLGAADFLKKPIKLLELDAVLEKSARIRNLRAGQRHLRETIKGLQAPEDTHPVKRSLVGNSQDMDKVREQIEHAVQDQWELILVSGENGTGKETVAREIHFLWGGPELPFIPVNCLALPDSLQESALFGYAKGAFPGADMDKAGYFELANGGTIFLDEITGLAPLAQAKLQKVLETKRLQRLGSSQEIEVNLRVMAASTLSLQELVELDLVHHDFFTYQKIFTINLCPLRERRSDILPLAEHFLFNYKASRGLRVEGFSEEARDILMNYDFPGNAWELRNMVERAAILCRSGTIEQKHLHLPKFSRMGFL